MCENNKGKVDFETLKGMREFGKWMSYVHRKEILKMKMQQIFDMRTDKNEKDKVVYAAVNLSDFNFGYNNGLCFIENNHALSLERLWNKAQESKTWGQFLSKLEREQRELFRDKSITITEGLLSGKLMNFPVPDIDEPLVLRDICLFGDENYFEWPLGTMLKWIPSEIINRYGKFGQSLLFGDFLILRPDDESLIVSYLEHCGVDVEENDALISNTLITRPLYYFCCPARFDCLSNCRWSIIGRISLDY